LIDASGRVCEPDAKDIAWRYPRKRTKSVGAIEKPDHHPRFQRTHAHLSRVFGTDWLVLKAEAFARFFGTPAQTVIVGMWIAANVLGIAKVEVYPFILLNLAFSLQAAYAAPLILLASSR
jgi:uncharacterized membrane protein